MGNTQNQLPITNYQFPITDLHRYHKCLNGHDIKGFISMEVSASKCSRSLDTGSFNHLFCGDRPINLGTMGSVETQCFIDLSFGYATDKVLLVPLPIVKDVQAIALVILEKNRGTLCSTAFHVV